MTTKSKKQKPKTAKPKPSPKPSPKPPAKPPSKTYLVFGADELAKPRAARFSADDPELLAKAVETMHLRIWSRSLTLIWPNWWPSSR